MLDTALNGKVQSILDDFDRALKAENIPAALAFFQEDCYWRDLVSFTWNIKTLEGQVAIADMLSHQLKAIGPSNWLVADDAPV